MQSAVLTAYYTVDMNILMLDVFLVSCERRYRLPTAVRINPYSARC
ncbi:hypothetical protein HMPREF9406_4135 [Clostridium sp. HGF2]|nr:hypothetical protein HMPREF9406_4135 [Clostridium sp. HGF2]EQJ51634.1 hypothetical protein QSI_4267 [Clostridioides difficile P28]